MPTNLAIDDELLEEALHLGGHRTKKATVNEALKEYIQRRKFAPLGETVLYWVHGRACACCTGPRG
ncbi:MAG: type II toxin-antitoxin system VapB family antitoxin [Thermoanaerobaculia bacterium]